MATLAELNGGPIVAIDVLPEDELPWRHIYGTQEFLQWMQDVLPFLVTTTVGSQLSPHEQVFASFDEFASGEPFNDDRRFKSLNRTPDLSVWEFKTDDVRIFGWIPCRDCFVATFGDLKDKIETMQLYGTYMAKTHFVRENLDLDAPKYLESKDYRDVISNRPE
jgi:hypothetical protein